MTETLNELFHAVVFHINEPFNKLLHWNFTRFATKIPVSRALYIRSLSVSDHRQHGDENLFWLSLEAEVKSAKYNMLHEAKLLSTHFCFYSPAEKYTRRLFHD